MTYDGTTELIKTLSTPALREIDQRCMGIGRCVFNLVKKATGDVYLRSLGSYKTLSFDRDNEKIDAVFESLGEYATTSISSPDPKNKYFQLVEGLCKAFPTVIKNPVSLSETDSRSQILALGVCLQIVEAYMDWANILIIPGKYDEAFKFQLSKMISGMSGQARTAPATTMSQLGAQIVEEVREKTGATPPTTA